MLVPSRFADLAPRPARIVLGVILLLTLAGLAASVFGSPGQSPARRAVEITILLGAMAPPGGPLGGLVALYEPPPGPDLVAYKAIVARVHAGENYHDVAAQVLPAFGFRTGSTFNFRLPTYAWVLGLFPGPGWIQLTLGILALAGMVLAYAGERRDLPPVPALVTVLLLAGVAMWVVDGDAYYAQEVWAAVLLLLSVAAYGLERRGLAVAFGLAALAFRELVLPYALIALGLAFGQGRRREGIAWLVGVVLFAGFLAWHASEVRQRLSASPAGSAWDWVRFGGYPFILSTVRMNWLLGLWPAPARAFYLGVALVGLIGWRSERGLLLSLTCLAYLAAFAVVGLPYNFNWGLMTAPLLCFGVVRAPRTIHDLWLASARGVSGE